jgi:hypothetical protein
MHPLLVDNVNLVNAQYSKANSSKKEHVKIVKKQKKTSFSKMWYDHQKLGECCYYCLNVNFTYNMSVCTNLFFYNGGVIIKKFGECCYCCLNVKATTLQCNGLLRSIWALF